MPRRSELYGDWGKLKNILHNLKDIDDEYESVIKEMGEKIAERVKSLIASQSIYLEPLEKEYLAQKQSEGRDERTLISSGEFLDSIKVIDIEIGDDSIDVFIGVEDGMTETWIPMKELAYYIEYGTENQPARMPFARSWEEMKAEITNEAMSKLKSRIGAKLR